MKLCLLDCREVDGSFAWVLAGSLWAGLIIAALAITIGG